MTDATSTPISPPEALSNPLSPVAHTSSFPHKTSAGTAPTYAFIETSMPAINSVAVELDGSAIEAPIADSERALHGAEGVIKEEGVFSKGDGGLKGIVSGMKKALHLGKGEGEGKGGVNVGLGEEEDIHAEFLGDGEAGAGRSVREQRVALLSTRSKDPGVIVDLPQEPTAEEVQAAKSAEVIITPAILGDLGGTR